MAATRPRTFAATWSSLFSSWPTVPFKTSRCSRSTRFTSQVTMPASDMAAVLKETRSGISS